MTPGTPGYVGPGQADARRRRRRARAVLAERVAKPLGLELLPAAHGVHTLANASMIRAIKAVSTYRGRDPRDFALLAFGGSGPVHAAAMARFLGMRRVVVPPAPGLFSATGLLQAEREQDLVQTFLAPLAGLDPATLAHAFDELEAIGWIGKKRPRMVVVQAAGCAPMVKAWQDGEEHAPRWQDAHTFAAGIRVPQAVGDFLILRAVRESGGFATAVDDAEIDDRGGEDPVLVVELPGLVHPFVQRVHDIEDQVALVAARGDIEESKLVGPLVVVAGGDLDRVPAPVATPSEHVVSPAAAE